MWSDVCGLPAAASLPAVQLGEAMTAIKAAMTWDEAAFGQEYDLVRTSQPPIEARHCNPTLINRCRIYKAGGPLLIARAVQVIE